ncbi:hypothetical protein BKA61DRAFT_631645 [Leptodontidium sp. MPI-SDFR-AT-0119]|nr:hypothetical protein BKA61DRAFT_631645 [Leptodontidium sp. MPI-SDFR-AT-0119]
MDWDERVERAHYVEAGLWSYKFNQCRGVPLTTWVSTFRGGMSCTLDGDSCGSFNWCCKVRFDDGVQWMVRFSVPGRVVNGDEKVKHEVATMRLIPWGVAADNPLGLGPFIIADFIEGESLVAILKEPESEILRSDLSDDDLDTIYRQIANIMLQLSKLNFPRIGSFSEMGDGSVTIDSRPVTLRAHEIVSSTSTTYSLATEYFHSIAKQDQQHLCEQLNSVDDEDDAKRKYTYCSIFKALLPRFLICDDFRPGNMLVNNRRDLKIVGVIDWEWAYAGSYQLLFSPPRWLLLKRPDAWGGKDKNSMPDRQSMADDKFWFNELIYSSFDGPDSMPWVQLRAMIPHLDDLATVSEAEVGDFVKMKIEP